MSEERDRERLAGVDPALAAAYFVIEAKFESLNPGGRLTIPPNGGYRTPTMQGGAASAGASGFNGQTSFSKHQAFPSRALDFMIVDAKGRLIVDGHDPLYRWAGEEFKAAGYVWGGDFHHPDWDHCEIPGPQPNAAQVQEAFAKYQATVKP